MKDRWAEKEDWSLRLMEFRAGRSNVRADLQSLELGGLTGLLARGSDGARGDPVFFSA